MCVYGSCLVAVGAHNLSEKDAVLAPSRVSSCQALGQHNGLTSEVTSTSALSCVLC